MEADQLQILIICIGIIVGVTIFSLGLWLSIRYYRRYYTIQGTIMLTSNDSSQYKLNSLNQSSIRSSFSDNSRTTERRSSIAMTSYSSNLNMSSIIVSEPVASYHSLQSKPSFPQLPSHIIKQPYQLTKSANKSSINILPL